ncbi:transposase [Paenisporosarcina antarctica]|uniref:transposase n=1 Tax=Paenisporosarcina antarctica TaxID=417367 RepID=UPI0038991FB4
MTSVIEVKDSKGNLLRLDTNRFDLTSDEISKMYKLRWAIELFFKWSKTPCKHQLETKSRTMILQIYRWLRVAIWKPHYVWIRKSAHLY